MELHELAEYARKKYNIQEQHKWADFPGFSVLCHPQTGKWIALLMRQWDNESGEEIQRCDIKCGRDSLVRFHKPYLSLPMRMQGRKWINIAFDDRTEKEVVFHLLDKAVAMENQHGYTIVLASRLTPCEAVYEETALPFAGKPLPPKNEKIPEKLREMLHLFKYRKESVSSKAENFYRQAVFMEDYEDDVPWTGNFLCYFPTYRNMTIQQLRGYFTWRARLRKGDFQPISTSAAYVYIYELLNGIGTDSPEDGLKKLLEFESGYLDSGIGDKRMDLNLRRWMLEYAVIHNIPAETAIQAADNELIKRDRALSVLRSPNSRSHDEIFSALCFFSQKLENSPVLKKDGERGKRLFGETWKAASGGDNNEGGLFFNCFGSRNTRRWYPLSSAVYYEKSKPSDRDYILDGCRSYHCRNGRWYVNSYEKLSYNKALMQSFIHGTDARLRRLLKTGGYLKDDPSDKWVTPYIDAVTEAEKKAVSEASKPKITIDLSGLEQIRKDALITQESLLMGEDWEEYEEAGTPALPAEEDGADEIPLSRMQIRILRTLLSGRDASEIIRANHLMPSIEADSINEAMFDEFGDTVILCEDDKLFLAEDYTEDLEQYLGGINDE